MKFTVIHFKKGVRTAFSKFYVFILTTNISYKNEQLRSVIYNLFNLVGWSCSTSLHVPYSSTLRGFSNAGFQVFYLKFTSYAIKNIVT